MIDERAASSVTVELDTLLDLLAGACTLDNDEARRLAKTFAAERFDHLPKQGQPSTPLIDVMLRSISDHNGGARQLGRAMYEKCPGLLDPAADSLREGQTSVRVHLDLLYTFSDAEDAPSRSFAKGFVEDKLRASRRPPASAPEPRADVGHSETLPAVSFATVLLHCVDNPVKEVRELGKTLYEESKRT